MALLPEEKVLIEPSEEPTPGWHRHTEDNQLGLHRHNPEDSMGGPHRHTPDNPLGEHIHGEFAGMALIDGKHIHGDDGSMLGGHGHVRDYLDTDSRLPLVTKSTEYLGSEDKKKKKKTELSKSEFEALQRFIPFLRPNNE